MDHDSCIVFLHTLCYRRSGLAVAFILLLHFIQSSNMLSKPLRSRAKVQDNRHLSASSAEHD